MAAAFAPIDAVAVIIVNYRTPDLAIDAVRALAGERGRHPGLVAMVVDGASGDGSAETIAAAIAASGWGWARLLALPVNGGFGYANNQAMLTLEREGLLPEHILLLNPDARTRPGAIGALAARMDSDRRIGAVGGALEHEDGSPQASAFYWPDIAGEFVRGVRTDVFRRLLGAPPIVAEAGEAGPVDWVTGAAVMLRRSALCQTGIFDDGFFLYFEETELLRRMTAAGYAIWHEPAARVVHLAGRSTNLRDPATGKLLPTRLPRYWYEARRRYFARTAGRAGALAAGLAYLAGRLLWQLRCLVTGRTDDDPARTTRDFARYALWAGRRDAAPRPVTLDDTPGSVPGWMQPG